MSTPLFLQNIYSPGDIVTLTAAVRDLSLNYPGKYDITVATRCADLWKGNPFVNHKRHLPKTQDVIDLNYAKYIPRKRSACRHFTTIYHKILENKLGIDIPVLKPHGDLYLSAFMEKKRPIDDKYWLIMPGGKKDWLTKLWLPEYWQTTINLLDKNGIQTVQTGHASGGTFVNPTLESSLNLTGWGGLLELVWLIRHCDGIICGVTSGMHIAACFNKPCVVLAGGKEPIHWESYTNHKLSQKFGPQCIPLEVEHKFLHTFGQLPCCSEKNACFKRDLAGDNVKRVCKSVIRINNQQLPACMRLITPENVVEAVLSYNTRDKDTVMAKQITRVVAVTPLLMLTLVKKRVFKTGFPALYNAITDIQKNYRKCCRSTKEVLAYNKDWNTVKKKLLDLDVKEKKKLKQLLEVRNLIVNYKDEADKSQRAVI